MKVLVCGGRDYDDWGRVYRVLDEERAARGVSFVIAGCADGADALALRWARDRSVGRRLYRAAWDDVKAPGAVVKYSHGRAYNAKAGPDRNQRMLDENPDVALVVAFRGGAGTDDMLARATAKGIEIRRVW